MTGMRNTVSVLSLFAQGSVGEVTIGTLWIQNRWSAIYVYSTGSAVGFGAYTPHFQGSSQFYEGSYTPYFSHALYKDPS